MLCAILILYIQLDKTRFFILKTILNLTTCCFYIVSSLWCNTKPRSHVTFYSTFISSLNSFIRWHQFTGDYWRGTDWYRRLATLQTGSEWIRLNKNSIWHVDLCRLIYIYHVTFTSQGRRAEYVTPPDVHIHLLMCILCPSTGT